jgi:hypothetical protein
VFSKTQSSVIAFMTASTSCWLKAWLNLSIAPSVALVRASGCKEVCMAGFLPKRAIGEGKMYFRSFQSLLCRSSPVKLTVLLDQVWPIWGGLFEDELAVEEEVGGF